MKRQDMQIGDNRYAFLSGIVQACQWTSDSNTILANIRWDADGKVCIGCRFAASLDLEPGDRVLVVKQTKGFGRSQEAWVAATTLRAEHFVKFSNVPPVPRLTFNAIKEECLNLLVWTLAVSSAAAGVWQFTNEITAAIAAGLGLLCFFYVARGRLRKLGAHKQSAAAEAALFSQLGLLLGEWVGELKQAEDAARASQGSDSQNRNYHTGEGQGSQYSGDAAGSQTPEQWWHVLGVPQTATFAQIKSAHRSCLKEYHPDRWMALPRKLKIEAERQAKLINVAMEQARTFHGAAD